MTWRGGCNILIVMIVIINALVIGLPFIPVVRYQAAAAGGRQQQLTRRIESSEATVTAGNRLTIPRMLLDEPVYRDRNVYRALDRGVAADPAFHAPDKNSNSVLLGHRFTYRQPQGVFYYLDKLQPGDLIALDWQGRRYSYRVSGSRVVAPSDTSPTRPTDDGRLTLYTCTPLIWPTQRLVVTALRSDQ